MARELLDFDLNSGLSYYTEGDGDKISVRSEQDCSVLLDHCSELRATGKHDKASKDHSMRMFCYLPNGVALEMMKKGINPYPGNDDHVGWRKFCHEINTNYPMLKVTDKYRS